MSKHRELALKTMELQMECLGSDGDPYNDQVCVIEEALRQVERETWEAAARVVLNQQGVSDWTDDDTIELLKQKAKEAGDDK